MFEIENKNNLSNFLGTKYIYIYIYIYTYTFFSYLLIYFLQLYNLKFLNTFNSFWNCLFSKIDKIKYEKSFLEKMYLVLFKNRK